MGDDTISMESMIRTTIILALFWNGTVSADVQKVVYMKNIFGHVHQNPMRHSRAVTTISCGYPVKVIKWENGTKKAREHWYRIETGSYRGFVRISHTSEKSPSCFQDKYPRFFDRAGLGPTDFYRWGRLQELLLRGTSRAKI